MPLVNLMSVGLEPPSKPKHNKASVEREGLHIRRDKISLGSRGHTFYFALPP